jgi:hypothetical protein
MRWNMKSLSPLFLPLMLIALSGCLQPNRLAPQKTVTMSTNAPTEPPYQIIANQDYNASLCDSIGYGSELGGLVSGIKIILTDKDTGEAINGGFSVSNGLNGAITPSITSEQQRFICEENADSNTSIISVYAPGHAPKVFPLRLPDGKSITLDVPLGGSCSMGLSCFDNFETQLLQEEPDRGKAAERMLEFRQQVIAALDEQFKLNETGYRLECLDCQMGRGGFILAAGTYKNGSGFRGLHHWGWCSSGGSDCGWADCFSSGDTDHFNRVKASMCAKLSSVGQHYENMCPGNSYDNTTLVQAKCASGEFENYSDKESTISIIQNSNRCNSYPEKGPTPCD